MSAMDHASLFDALSDFSAPPPAEPDPPAPSAAQHAPRPPRHKQEQQRLGMFRMVAGLAVAALVMLVGTTYFVITRVENSAQFYVTGIVDRSWTTRKTEWHNAVQALARTHDSAQVEHRAAVAGALRAITHSGNVSVILQPASAQPRAADTSGTRTRLSDGRVFVDIAAPALHGEGRPQQLLVSVEVDKALLKEFGQFHNLRATRLLPLGAPTPGLTALVLRGPDGAPLVQMAWVPLDTANVLRKQLPATLLVMMTLFGLLAWVILRRSSTITNDLIASEARARHLAFHDTLTGLPNRAMMNDRLHQLLAIGRRYQGDVAVHCLDLDRFKEVNDTLGHPAGDELIRQVADRLTDLCRESDTVARLGGDEFVILQPETNASGASHLAERVLKIFETPFELDSGVVEVGCSIGVSLITNPDIDAVEAMRQADLALYQSKEGGRNRITFFEPDMDAALRMRRSLETDLRKALANNALTMVYQPQIDHREHITAMEALVRWTHPEKGPISPTIFVPLCEETGLILDLGEFVMDRVFQETAHWLGTRVAINVSPLQLRSPMFMAMVTRLVARYNIDPSRYEIEITETALLGDDGVTRDNLLMLKQEGFTIALDDFGTGYSSLNSLKRFAVDKIKIDRSFIHNLEANDEAEALVDAIVKLGRAMKLSIVAEGVETEAQRDRLAACGCNHFQGFLVSKPVPASELNDIFFG
ncbi:EAL domain-containing protein [Novosphingobium sp. FSY-8]|uniref:EAL domain-containing protein n=1 Tax=Novosphingobium ovatum TaxID=1908523 RepID=A0ABW9XH57_9SPHN|nr:EAL domain-containing protein [Novosphingobium ovatum]NBC37889.1 EAL domain-containing protein [Novosphingobium ovatum]